MTYLKSRARKTFDFEIDSCIAVIRKSQNARGVDPIIREYVLSNAILRTSAKIESYLEDVITDWVTELNASSRITDEIPSAMRVRHFATAAIIDACRRFIAIGDENGLLESLEGVLGTPEIAFATNGVNCPSLSSPDILNARKYPSVKNMKVLFARIGLKPIFPKLNASARANLELTLESFNGIRGSLAHVGLPVGYNANDVKKLLEDIKSFIAHLDRVLFSHVLTVSGLESWKV